MIMSVNSPCVCVYVYVILLLKKYIFSMYVSALPEYTYV